MDSRHRKRPLETGIVGTDAVRGLESPGAPWLVPVAGPVWEKKKQGKKKGR